MTFFYDIMYLAPGVSDEVVAWDSRGRFEGLGWQDAGADYQGVVEEQ